MDAVCGSLEQLLSVKTIKLFIPRLQRADRFGAKAGFRHGTLDRTDDRIDAFGLNLKVNRHFGLRLFAEHLLQRKPH